MPKTLKLLASVASLAVFAGAASAQNLGSVELSFTGIAGSNSPGGDAGQGLGATLSANAIFPVGTGGRIILEGAFTEYQAEEDPWYSDPGSVSEIGVHYLRDTAGGNLTYGAFLTVGSAISSASDPDDETYDYVAIGGQVLYQINPNFMAYAQAAFVDNPTTDISDSGGYDDGNAFRVGAYYTGFERSAFYLDYEIGAADGYEGSNEDGRFYSVAIGGETQLNGPWSITYEVSVDQYEAENDSNRVDIATIGLGVKYTFGGDSRDLLAAGAIGSPDILGRASVFTDALN